LTHFKKKIKWKWDHSVLESSIKNDSSGGRAWPEDWFQEVKNLNYVKNTILTELGYKHKITPYPLHCMW
jgi:hypothetical protein